MNLPHCAWLGWWVYAWECVAGGEEEIVVGVLAKRGSKSETSKRRCSLSAALQPRSGLDTLMLGGTDFGFLRHQ